MTDTSSTSENVKIMGEELPIRSSKNPELISEAKNLVTRKIESIRNQASQKSVTRLKIALLSCLNIAGELIKLRQNPDENTLSEDTINRAHETLQILNDKEIVE